ncbi:MAG TPA: hypothetical protein DEF34_10240 [Desulfotomaculum sp.]|nr:MAG: hypothetical protein JL56_05815 [Desulfotomaculum sp. BICA1-6]HBX23993.1 hypothetical protein [Desulfotomaculum sp.]
MNKHTFSIHQRQTSLRLDNNEKLKNDHLIRNFRNPKYRHYPILHRVLNFMQTRGFEVGRDPHIQKRFKCLNKDHWYGRKGELEFKAERYPAGFRIEFFQNVVFENPNGGYYDFDKYAKMPYLMKLLFINESSHIKTFLESLGCMDVSTPQYKTAKEKIKSYYVKSWHHPQNSMGEFELEDLHGQTSDQTYNNTDNDGKTIYNGQIKYFRDTSTGRLARGTVYHNINSMWWLVLNKTEYTNVASFQLFDPTEANFNMRRLKRDKKPKEFLQKQEKMQQASTKELVNELKRRGTKLTA